MAIAIAAIRRASESLRERKKDVSIAGIAHVLKQPESDVRTYIYRIKGLADEIGPIVRKGSKKDRVMFVAAAAELVRLKIPVTYDALAGQMDMNTKNLSIHLSRHPDLKEALGIISQSHGTIQKTRDKLEELVASLQGKEEKVFITMVAEYCGLDNSQFYRLCKRDHSLWTLIEPYLRAHHRRGISVL